MSREQIALSRSGRIESFLRDGKSREVARHLLAVAEGESLHVARWAREFDTSRHMAGLHRRCRNPSRGNPPLTDVLGTAFVFRTTRCCGLARSRTSAVVARLPRGYSPGTPAASAASLDAWGLRSARPQPAVERACASAGPGAGLPPSESALSGRAFRGAGRADARDPASDLSTLWIRGEAGQRDGTNNSTAILLSDRIVPVVPLPPQR